MRKFETIQRFCANYRDGYTVLGSHEPAFAGPPVGERGATSCAQLVEPGNVIFARPCADSLHSIAHEIGHAVVRGERGADCFDEHLVTIEQIAFLVAFCKLLLQGAPRTMLLADGRVLPIDR